MTGCVASDIDLIDDMTGPEYDFHTKGQIKLESKKDMKKRGLSSPDHADALALTFAQPVSRRNTGFMTAPVIMKGFNPLQRGV